MTSAAAAASPDPLSYFDNWFFTTPQSKGVCPDFGDFKCGAPNKACARDPSNGRRYCCDGPTAAHDSVCWSTPTTPCKSDGSTVDCGDGDTKWCCVAGSEKCTETAGQLNICWSTHLDPLNNISAPALAQVYSSLSSARPSANSLTFDPVAIIRATATGAGTITTGAAPSSVPTQAQTAGGDGSATSIGPSGGAVAGIVIGMLAALGVLAAVVFFVVRWRKRQRLAAQNIYPATPTDMRAVDGGHAGAASAITPFREASDKANAAAASSGPSAALLPAELSPHGAAGPPMELAGDESFPPQELPASARLGTGSFHPSPMTSALGSPVGNGEEQSMLR